MVRPEEEKVLSHFPQAPDRKCRRLPESILDYDVEYIGDERNDITTVLESRRCLRVGDALSTSTWTRFNNEILRLRDDTNDEELKAEINRFRQQFALVGGDFVEGFKSAPTEEIEDYTRVLHPNLSLPNNINSNDLDAVGILGYMLQNFWARCENLGLLLEFGWKGRRGPEEMPVPRGSSFGSLRKTRFQLKSGLVIFPYTAKPQGFVSYNGWPLILIQAETAADSGGMFNSRLFLPGAYFLQRGSRLVRDLENLFTIVVQVMRGADKAVILNTAWIDAEMDLPNALPGGSLPIHVYNRRRFSLSRAIDRAKMLTFLNNYLSHICTFRQALLAYTLKDNGNGVEGNYVSGRGCNRRNTIPRHHVISEKMPKMLDYTDLLVVKKSGFSEDSSEDEDDSIIDEDERWRPEHIKKAELRDHADRSLFVIKGARSSNPHGTRELRMEKRILRYLTSQKSPINHTIPIKGICTIEGQECIVLPLFSSFSAFNLFTLMELQPYPAIENTFTSLSRQLIEGVAFLHYCGIAHLDLKPGNLVIDLNTHSLYIIDFGSSIWVTTRHRCGVLEKPRGTRGWSAPEICIDNKDNQQPYGIFPADVWACGNLIEHLSLVLRYNDRDGDCDYLRFASFLKNSVPERRPLLHTYVKAKGNELFFDFTQAFNLKRDPCVL